MRRGLSWRLLLLAFFCIAGFSAMATAIAGAVIGDVALFPVFAAGAFAGGLLGARLNRRRTVVEVAIAATACGAITGVVNLVYDDLDLLDVPVSSRSLTWAVGISATCLVAAVIGGRIGERLSDRPPGFVAVGLAFTAASIGLVFAALPLFVLVGELFGALALAVVEVPLMFLSPSIAAVMVGVSVDREVPLLALFVVPFAISAGISVLMVVEGAAIVVVVAVPVGFAFWGGFFGWVGAGMVLPWVERRLGPVEADEPAIAEARARD